MEGLFEDWLGAYNIPTAMIPQIAIFFFVVICNLRIRGNGRMRMKMSFSIFSIPAARKNWLMLMHFPVVPLNCVQKNETGLHACAITSTHIVARSVAVSADGSSFVTLVTSA